LHSGDISTMVNGVQVLCQLLQQHQHEQAQLQKQGSTLSSSSSSASLSLLRLIACDTNVFGLLLSLLSQSLSSDSIDAENLGAVCTNVFRICSRNQREQMQSLILYMISAMVECQEYDFSDLLQESGVWTLVVKCLSLNPLVIRESAWNIVCTSLQGNALGVAELLIEQPLFVPLLIQAAQRQERSVQLYSIQCLLQVALSGSLQQVQRCFIQSTGLQVLSEVLVQETANNLNQPQESLFYSTSNDSDSAESISGSIQSSEQYVQLYTGAVRRILQLVSLSVKEQIGALLQRMGIVEILQQQQQH
jgi:hypothetical protein